MGRTVGQRTDNDDGTDNQMDGRRTDDDDGTDDGANGRTEDDDDGTDRRYVPFKSLKYSIGAAILMS